MASNARRQNVPVAIAMKPRMKDEKRLDVIQRVYRGELTVVQAALVMGVSERSFTESKPGSVRPERREWFTATGDVCVSAKLRRRHRRSGLWN